MKWLAAALLALIALLQCRLWLSHDGVRDLQRLEGAVAAQSAENERLVERNRELAGEVRDLKSGTAALEERARSELGMIRQDEVFFQLQAGTVAKPDRPAAGAAKR